MFELNGSFFSLYLSFKIIVCVIPCLILFSLLISYMALGAKRKLRLILDICVNIPIIFPPIGTGFLLVYLCGSEGVIGKLLQIDLMFSFTGLCVGAVITGIPFIAHTMLTGLNREVCQLCEVSYTLGKSKIETFFRIVLPQLHKNIIAGILLASARILGEVGISLMIGGNIPGKTNTMSLEIYNAVLNGNNETAVKMTFSLIAFSILIFISIKLLDKGEKIV